MMMTMSEASRQVASSQPPERAAVAPIFSVLLLGFLAAALRLILLSCLLCSLMGSPFRCA